MNREIKFRGKSIETNDWVYGFYIANINPHEIKDIYDNHFIYEGINIKKSILVKVNSVNQLTGLKDCNNIDIYEGDILQVQLPLGGFWGYIKTEKIGVVEYNNDKCTYVVRWEYSRNQNYIQLDCDLEVKVIGNIYENKELLK